MFPKNIKITEDSNWFNRKAKRLLGLISFRLNNMTKDSTTHFLWMLTLFSIVILVSLEAGCLEKPDQSQVDSSIPSFRPCKDKSDCLKGEGCDTKVGLCKKIPRKEIPRILESDGPDGSILKLTMDDEFSNRVPEKLEVFSSNGDLIESYEFYFQSWTVSGMTHFAYLINKDANGKPRWSSSIRFDGYNELAVDIWLEPLQTNEKISVRASGLQDDFLQKASGLLIQKEGRPALAGEFSPSINISIVTETTKIDMNPTRGDLKQLEYLKESRKLSDSRLGGYLNRARTIYLSAPGETPLAAPVIIYHLLTDIPVSQLVETIGVNQASHYPQTVFAVSVASLGELLDRWILGDLTGALTDQTCTPEGPGWYAWPGPPPPPEYGGTWEREANRIAEEIIEDKTHPRVAPGCIERRETGCTCTLSRFTVSDPVRREVIRWSGEAPAWQHNRIGPLDPEVNPITPFQDTDVYTRTGTIEVFQFDVTTLTIILNCAGDPPCPNGEQSHTKEYFLRVGEPTVRSVTERLEKESLDFAGGSEFRHPAPDRYAPPNPENIR